MTQMKIIEKVLKDLDLKYNFYKQDDRKYFEVEFWCNNDKDCIYCLWVEKDLYNTWKKVNDEAEDYDIDGEVELFLGAKSRGFKGVPPVRALVEDCEEEKGKIQQIADRLYQEYQKAA